MSDFQAKCIKKDFRWGSAPDPAGGAYSSPPDLLAAFKGLLIRERGGKGKGGRSSLCREGDCYAGAPPIHVSGYDSGFTNHQSFARWCLLNSPKVR